MMLRGWVVMVGLGLGMLLVPREAEACSCARGVMSVSPVDGSTGVPLNVQPQAVFNSTTPALRLTREDGAEVAVEEVRHAEAGFVRLIPREPLAPRTTYVLTDMTFQGNVSRFTTGEATDTQAPDFAGVQGSSFKDTNPLGLPVSGGMCGDSRYHALQVATPNDTSASAQDVFFHVYVGEDEGSVDLSAPARIFGPRPTVALGSLACSFTDFPLEGRRGLAVVVTAVDWAGNESAPGEPYVLQGAGCGCTQAAGATAPLALLLLGRLVRLRARSA